MLGGNRLPCDQDDGDPDASLLETKLLLNNIVFDASKGVRLMPAETTYHLATPMKNTEYVRVKH